MKKPKLLLIIPLLIISILPVLPAAIPRAHAATGTVCLTDNVTVGCPASPEVLFASQGTTLTVLVQISGSDALNGFNVQIQTDNTVLQAAGASLTGSVIGSGATIVLECLDGTLVVGNACDSTDGPGVLHFAATKTGALVGGTGLLFTATYNTLSKTPGINVNLMAVTISNGSGVGDSETLESATFSNLTDFGITSAPASISTPPGVNGMSTITLTSFGGFTDFITVSTTATGALSASTADTFVFLPPDGTVSTILTVNGPSGTYTVTVTAQSTSTSPIVTHSATVPVTVTAQDFTLASNPTSLTLAPGNSGTTTINVGSVAGFNGAVALSASSALGASVSPGSVTAPGSATLTVTTASSTAPGSYAVTVTGAASVGTHSISIMVTVGVPDYSLTAAPDTVTVFRNDPFATAVSTLNFGSINNFAGTITVTATISFAFISTPGSASLPFTVASSVTLVAGGSATDNFIATVARATAGTGLYHSVITTTGGGQTHTATVDIWVIDYTVTPQDTVVTMPDVAGTIGQDPISIGAIGAPFNATGFNINPGFTEGTPQFPTIDGYLYSSSSGRGFNGAATGIDTSFTSSRCFLEVFDSSNNLIHPVISGGKVQSFAAPVVHLNGDQFGFPSNANGCRFDGFWYVDPLNGNTLGAATDTAFITIEPTLQTAIGTYTALVCLQAGGDIHCLSITINMVAPPAAPSLNQFTGRTPTVSLAAGGIGNFKVGVTSNDATRTVYVSVTINAVSLDGTISVTGTSGVVAIPAGGRVNNIAISLDLSSVPAGTTLNENLVINYGVAPHYTTLTSTQTVGTSLKLTGSIVVTP